MVTAAVARSGDAAAAEADMRGCGRGWWERIDGNCMSGDGVGGINEVLGATEEARRRLKVNNWTETCEWVRRGGEMAAGEVSGGHRRGATARKVKSE